MRKTRQSKSKKTNSDLLDFSETTIKVKGKTKKLLKCRKCDFSLSKQTMSAMRSHRNVCKTNEVNDESSKNQLETIDAPRIKIEFCIVCNSASNLCDQNIGDLQSKHSEARICDLIHRCLGTTSLNRNIEDESNQLCICNECIAKFNEYDLACVTAERVGYELQQMLAQTDQLSKETGLSKSVEIETGQNMISDNSNHCYDNNDEDGTNDYSENSFKTKLSEVQTLQTHDEHNEIDRTFSDADNDSKESIGNEIQHVDDNPRVKRIYECDTCPEKFNFWKELRKHRAEHRNENAKYRCDICNFDPKNEDALAEHKKLHNGLSPLQCVICKKIFIHKRNIRPHMRLHTGQKKYQCDRCGKEYFHKSSFTLHMAYHDGIRTINCPHCPKQFMAKTDLEKHIRIHTGEKPYPCGVCGKSFARRANMREHQKIHDKQKTEKPYSCTYCEASFARPSKLHKHLEKHGVANDPSDVRLVNEFTKNANNR